MERYFATSITGTKDIIAARLRQYPNSTLVVKDVQDGLVFFESGLTPNQLAELRFFNNVYRFLGDFASEPTQQQLVDAARTAIPPNATFIVRVREGSQPASPPVELIQALSQATGSTHVAHKPQYQLALLKRTDGRVLWGTALQRAGFKTLKLEPGEVRPELAHILGLVASVDSKDIVIDPFAGYGGIVREMLQGFHCKQVIAVEHNERLVPHLKSIPGLIAFQGDAGNIEHVETHHVDRVITDPPWGDFSGQAPEELKQLYHAALIQMHRVLRAKGCAVILTAADFLPGLAKEIGFTVEKQYSILVSGKKATIFKLRKT